MKYSVGFSSPDQSLLSQYDRYKGAMAGIWSAGDRLIVARVFTEGTTQAATWPLTKPLTLKLVSIETGAMVSVLESEPTPSGALPDYVYGKSVGWCNYKSYISCYWTIKKGAVPDGIYHLTSSADSTLLCPIIFNNGAARVESKYLLAQSEYMRIGRLRGWPENRNYAIIPNPGVRVGSTAPDAPFLDGGKFDAPLVNTEYGSNLYAEEMIGSAIEYSGRLQLVDTPKGGPVQASINRYSIVEYFRPNPALDALNPKLSQWDNAPTDMRDGGIEESLGGCPVSGYELANKDIIVLWANGRITRTEFLTRRTTTLYGWRLKPGAMAYRQGNLLPAGVPRMAWYLQYCEFVGDGPDIGRAWQICPDNANEMICYVADPTNHIVHKIDLTTRASVVVAGKYGFAGHAAGVVGVGMLAQPRGVVQIKTGQHAGKLVVASEHSSAYMLVDLVSGMMTTLTRALRVPTVFNDSQTGDFKPDTLVNRTAWGATVKVQSFDNAQFCHPCQLGLMSDGKTVVGAHHDELQVFKLDLDSRTITIHYSLLNNKLNQFANKHNWPIIGVDATGACGAIDAIYYTSWHAQSPQIILADGTTLPYYVGGNASSSDSHGAPAVGYPRLFAPLPSGALLLGDDGKNSLYRLRKVRPDDPKRDAIMYNQGEAIYQADGPNGRAPVSAINGAAGKNHLAGYKTPGELAMLTPAARKAYMIAKFGVTDWTDLDHKLVAYYLDHNCAVGVGLIRGNIERPDPIPDAPPVVIPHEVTNLTPIDSTAKQQLSFWAATFEVQFGATIERLGTGARVSPDDLKAVDWVVVG